MDPNVFYPLMNGPLPRFMVEMMDRAMIRPLVREPPANRRRLNPVETGPKTPVKESKPKVSIDTPNTM